MHRIQALMVAIITILVWTMIIRPYLYENYESKREKAKTIHTWFKSNQTPQYSNYKEQVPDSDIVEYSQVKEIFKHRMPNVSDIERAL